ncbi:hypothetical protein ES703_98270 [subsurface metagenome]
MEIKTILLFFAVVLAALIIYNKVMHSYEPKTGEGALV